MSTLKGETKSDREKGYALKDNSGNLSESYFEGIPGENFLDVDVSGGVNAIIHSHYTGLLSIFSPDDIFVMAAAYKGGYIKDTNNFVLGVVTDSGTQYYMVIDDINKFSSFTNGLFNGSSFDNISLNVYSDFYKKIAKINSANHAIINEYNFLNYLDINNTGLKVLKGSENMEEWSAIKKGDNKNEIIEEKCP
ncbi:hypothetical protein [uncultured Chryseobacterium sp.]|uniref:hypothetical protein n=1 Tax=uncultured Chryseobacterium sp. TaxID=259322 RepID=UPI00261B5E99|nr:hypothetical protein [uncultured Chryseobacterium sp.]